MPVACVRHAPRMARFAAAMLDGAGGGLAFAPVMAVGVLGAWTGHARAVGPLVQLLTVGGFLWWYLWIWTGVARTGQSYGKRCCGIRIVDRRGAGPGFLRGVVVRAWFIPLAAAWIETNRAGWGMVLAYADLVFLLLPGSRCLHDWIAMTRVVEDVPDAEDEHLEGQPASPGPPQS